MSIRTFADGALVEETEDAAAETRASREAIRANLLSRIDAAITADLAYLDLDPPTTGQVVAQVERLTRQTVALLRLVGNRLDDTTGT